MCYKWFLMDSQNAVISDGFDYVLELLDCALSVYTPVEMLINGFTFCRLSLQGSVWVECLEELKIDDLMFV